MSRNARSNAALAIVISFSALPTMSVAAEPAIAAKSNPALVVDADGRSLGALMAPDQVLLTYPDGDAVLRVGTKGYEEGSPKDSALPVPENFLFESVDCSGPAYRFSRDAAAPALAAFRKSSSLAAQGYTSSGRIYYATRAPLIKTLRSGFDLGKACQQMSLPRDQAVVPIKSVAVPSYRLPISIILQPASNTGASGVGVFDADGKYVGAVLDQGSVWMKFTDGEVVLDTDEMGGFKDSGTQLYFKTGNCTGSAYMNVAGTPTRGNFSKIPAGHVVSRGTIHYPRRPYETIVFRSSLYTNTFNPRTARCIAEKPASILAGKEAVVTLNGFKPPLAIK